MVRKINRSVLYVTILMAVTLGFSGCDDSTDDPLFTSKTVTLDLKNEDVYFIFTNPSPVEEAPVAPSVSCIYPEEGERAGVDNSRVSQSSLPMKSAVSAASGRIDRIGEIKDAQLWKLPEGISPESGSSFRGSGISYSYVPPTEDVGTERTFFGASGIDPAGSMSIPAVCRGKREADGRTLLVYVADDCWIDTGDTNDKTNLVTDAMVRALIDEFLSSGTGNDIWDWVTDLFGNPWGTAANDYSSLIGSGAENYITILLYDIADDNATNGGTVGYFNSLNNFENTDRPQSNERLMFAIDAVLYATDDYWSRAVYSTLAHEFQHMIQFYQKQIVFHTGSSEIWLNEMCSLVTEDLLADKIGVPGPRGVNPDSDDGSAGIPKNCYSSRISTYNYWNDDSLTTWGGENDTSQYKSYATAYTFGAFLARNYGGAALFRNIVQSQWTDERAVTEAIAKLGSYGNPGFGDLMVEWAEAAITSDTIVTDASVKTYNSGGFFQSSPTDPAGSGYNLGSINLYNYDADDGDNKFPGKGPIPYGDESGAFGPLPLDATAPAVNLLYLAGTDLTGEHTWNVEIPTGMIFTVLKK